MTVTLERDALSSDRDDLDVFNAREPVHVASTEESARYAVERIAETHPLLREMGGRLVIIRFALDIAEQQARAAFNAKGAEEY